MTNAFLVPCEGGEGLVVRRGSAHLPFMTESLRLPDGSALSDPIYLLELDAASAFDTYLGRGEGHASYFAALHAAVGLAGEA